MGSPSAVSVHWSWPSAARWVFAARLYAALTLLFGCVYFGANWWAAQRGGTARLHAGWELGIPFVPAAVVVYFSIALIFVLPLFSLEEKGLVRLARAFAVCTCMAGVVFVALPFQIGFERPASVAGFETVYAALYRFDAPFNTLPSLHIAYSTLILGVLAAGCQSRLVRLALAGWWLAVCASVLLVHQHHVADVVTGAALGAASGWRLMFNRRARG